MLNKRLILFTTAALLIVMTAFSLMTRVLPFKISHLLHEGSDLRARYEKYNQLFNEEGQFFILLEAKHAPNEEEIWDILDLTHYELGKFRPHLKEVTSLYNSEYLKKYEDYVFFDSFFWQKKLRQQAKEELKKPFWKNTLISQNQKNLLLQGEFLTTVDIKTERRIIAELLKKLEDLEIKNPEWNFHIIGTKVVQYHLYQDMKRGQETIVPLLMLLIAVLVFLVFRNTAVLFWFSIIMLLGQAATIYTMILLRGGIDALSSFAIFFILIVATSDLIHFFDFYCRLPGRDKATKIKQTVKYLYRPCFYTSLTTFVGFLSMTISDISSIQDIGLFCALGCIYCFLLTFHFLPWVMGVTAFYPEVKKPPFSLKLNGLFMACLRKYKLIVLLFSLGTGILLFNSFPLKIDDSFYDRFHPSHPISRATNIFIEQFNFLGTIDLSVNLTGIEITEEKTRQKLGEFERKISELSTVSNLKSASTFYDYLASEIIDQERTVSLFNTLESLHVLDSLFKRQENIYRMIVQVNSSSSSTIEHTLEQIKGIYQKDFAQDFKMEPMGFITIRSHIFNSFIVKLMESLALNLVAIFLIFWFLLKKFKYALIAMIPNIIPLIFLAGIMGILQIPVENNAILMLCITIGISVDDTIHFMYAFVNQDKNQSLNKSLVQSFKKTNSALFATTMVFVFSFPCFFIADLKIFYQSGSFIVLALLIALIADLFLLPPLLKLCLNNTRGK
jgi:uncharacterized protein